ncbi:secondary thiamine-phosphate synthase enzyme YjbQ [Stutzerimonas sp. R40042]|uniref:secondary thiamine-phosphate synthase enzyme YjbQ n=1 Tax=Stutzerimonas TaxID=2901164 RepID=UPI001E390A25|nr:secondary thiamine-phosphate synthase enzyme YjbQ [Stutzerimonas sp. R40042]MCD1640269.1 secondary thiamine-phosphate synthase enzyme YjbQ [Stutzerimonas stutzeri]WAE62555.1 secondary thiamine-phosphate synthase enzyme YjbQ [Stutzerimonas sp. R40042]
MWQQTLITLRARPRGFHLITDEVLGALPELRRCQVGLLHLWLRHTSASLTINENADAAVRRDFERFFNRLVPQGEEGYEHDYEGPDDLPAHFKASLLGCQLSLPVSTGRLALGTWQGIYLGEHRDQGGARLIVATLHGTAS